MAALFFGRDMFVPCICLVGITLSRSADRFDHGCPMPNSGAAGLTADELKFLRNKFRDVPWPRALSDWLIARKAMTGARAGHLRSASAESLIARGLLAVEVESPLFVRVRPT
jgi:hypothetical protein